MMGLVRIKTTHKQIWEKLHFILFDKHIPFPPECSEVIDTYFLSICLDFLSCTVTVQIMYNIQTEGFYTIHQDYYNNNNK